MAAFKDALVSTDWLAAHLDDLDLRIADASWYMPDSGKNARASHAGAHIPGAAFFDIDEIADRDSALPHMLPSPEAFAVHMQRLGIGDDSKVVVYDDNFFCASARAWWMLRVFGHEQVAVLDGGLARWRAEGRPLDDGPARAAAGPFTPRSNRLLVRDLARMRANVERRGEQMVDARSAGRFTGAQPEPRPNMRSGHIPGSLNLPFTDLIDDETRRLLPKDELRLRIEAAGVDLDQPIATTCGSGVSAAVLNLALYRLGREDAALYDGSWSEWGAREDTPIEP